MSSVSDSEATIIAFIDTIRPNFDYITAMTAFSACLFTLFVLLLALSTKESRRRVVFRLNVLAICTVLTTSILAGLCNWKAIVDPYNPVSTSVFIAADAFHASNHFDKKFRIPILRQMCSGSIYYSLGQWRHQGCYSFSQWRPRTRCDHHLVSQPQYHFRMDTSNSRQHVFC